MLWIQDTYCICRFCILLRGEMSFESCKVFTKWLNAFVFLSCSHRKFKSFCEILNTCGDLFYWQANNLENAFLAYSQHWVSMGYLLLLSVKCQLYKTYKNWEDKYLSRECSCWRLADNQEYFIGMEFLPFLPVWKYMEGYNNTHWMRRDRQVGVNWKLHCPLLLATSHSIEATIPITIFGHQWLSCAN